MSICATEQYSMEQIFENKGNIYTFLNPVSYLTALDNQQLFGQFDGIFADGALLVRAIRKMYGIQVTRRSFDMTSMTPQLFAYAVSHRKTIYIVASTQSQEEKAVELLEQRYPGVVFAGHRNGYFASEEDMDQEAKYICEVNPDFLIVGMGTLVQEKFLLKVKNAGFRGIGFSCGAFIRQIAKTGIDYYPAWVDRMNLRFVYRIWKEPHTRKRYVKAGILFPLRFFWERLQG